jgi:hypothetical protein
LGLLDLALHRDLPDL